MTILRSNNDSLNSFFSFTKTAIPMKLSLPGFILMLTFCTINTRNSATYIIDTGRFQIEVPSNWKYVKQQGIDSFVGLIEGPGVALDFDYSERHYANDLTLTKADFPENYHIELDTIENRYLRKIIFPEKRMKNGITGVYFEDLKGPFNFNIYGRNLAPTAQEKALTAFKTVKINRK